jgi:hypothetical protein
MRIKNFKSTVLFATVALTAAGAAGCQKDEPVAKTASIGTVTGLVSNAQRASQLCGPTGTHDVESRIWAALPPRLQSEFRGDRFRPVLALNPSEICSQILEARGQGGANQSSCYKVEVDDADHPFPHMLLPQDPVALNQAMIMTAVMTYMDFFFDSVLGPAGDDAVLQGVALTTADKQMVGFTSRMRSARQALARAFLDDLRGAKMDEPLSHMSEQFRTSVDSLQESVDFQNYVLVHIADSYYCNPDTAKELNLNLLVRTRGAFMPFVDFFGAPWFANPGQALSLSH